MVLQRAPERAVVYGQVCGGLAGAAAVSVSIDGGPPTTTALAAGARSWQVALPPQPGGLEPHTVTIKGIELLETKGGPERSLNKPRVAYSMTLRDVLFGDSILCSGQSNMCFSLNQMTGAKDEIALADEPRFRSIRLFTVNPGYDASGPHTDVAVMQPWSVANSSTVGDNGAGKPFSTFSAACWVQVSRLLVPEGRGDECKTPAYWKCNHDLDFSISRAAATGSRAGTCLISSAVRSRLVCSRPRWAGPGCTVGRRLTRSRSARSTFRPARTGQVFQSTFINSLKAREASVHVT